MASISSNGPARSAAAPKIEAAEPERDPEGGQQQGRPDPEELEDREEPDQESDAAQDRQPLRKRAAENQGAQSLIERRLAPEPVNEKIKEPDETAKAQERDRGEPPSREQAQKRKRRACRERPSRDSRAQPCGWRVVPGDRVLLQEGRLFLGFESASLRVLARTPSRSRMTSPMSAGRSWGALAVILSTVAASALGTALTHSSGGTIGFVCCSERISTAVLPSNGGRPVSRK